MRVEQIICFEHRLDLVLFDGESWKCVCSCGWEAWNSPTETEALDRHLIHSYETALREIVDYPQNATVANVQAIARAALQTRARPVCPDLLRGGPMTTLSIPSELVARLMAAIETPDDLTDDDRTALIEDTSRYYAEDD